MMTITGWSWSAEGAAHSHPAIQHSAPLSRFEQWCTIQQRSAALLREDLAAVVAMGERNRCCKRPRYNSHRPLLITRCANKQECKIGGCPLFIPIYQMTLIGEKTPMCVTSLSDHQLSPRAISLQTNQNAEALNK